MIVEQWQIERLRDYWRSVWHSDPNEDIMLVLEEIINILETAVEERDSL